MRSTTQIAALVLIAGLGAGWHLYGERVGLPTPLALMGLEATASTGGAARQQPPQEQPVVVTPIRVGQVIERAESVGTVRARESITVTAKVTGMVTAIPFQEGQRVRGGEVLVQLDAAALRAELDQARALHDDARNQMVRAQRLQPGQTIAEQRMVTLEALARQAEGRVRQAEARLEELRITAPFDGRVGLRQVSIGALVQPGTVVTTLDDTARVRVEFSVPEVHLARLRVGSEVRAASSAYGDRVFSGRVAVLDTRIDPATRSIRVISEFDNADEALRPGLFLTVILTLASRENALLVPEEAIDPLGERAFIYVVRDGRARRLEVRLGVRLPGEVEIREGVAAAGEQVVVRGIQRLRHDLPVRVTETMTRPAS